MIPSMDSLASVISFKASEISDILAANAIPSPSFGESSFADFTEDADTNVGLVLRKARNELISAAQDIIRLAMGPIDQILTLAWSATDTSNLGIVVRFEIPQNVPSDSSISLKDLASTTGLPEDVLARTVRYAIGNGIFCEPSPGFFAHTAASASLARNEHIRNIALLSTHEISSILVKLADSLKLQQENKKLSPAAAFNVAYPSYDTVFEYFSKNTDASDRYHTYLNGRVNTSRWSVHHLATAWDWASVRSGTVVDVGGSSGHTCRALAPICPNAKFFVQDLSTDALKKGSMAISSDPSLQERIAFVQHDFFTPQPITADIYIIRHILHDWSDADSVRILKALIPALKNGAKVFISEGIMPEPPATRLNTLDRKQIRIEDTFMLAVHYACERSIADFIALFKQASPYYHYAGVTGGENGAFQSLLEFIYRK